MFNAAVDFAPEMEQMAKVDREMFESWETVN